MKGLEIRGLVYEAGGRRILDGLDLKVSRPEVHALIGANGTGKSTLASIIMGLSGFEPQAGSLVFDGGSIDGLAIHERAALGITLAWQEPVRFEGIRVSDYLSFGSRAGAGLTPKAGAQSRALTPQGCLSLVGLNPVRYMDRFVDDTLSGGERKRIELASALAMRPALAVLDEPDSGIDILSIEGVIRVIRAFSDGGAGVLVITHRQEIASAADRASHLCFGRIVNTGDPLEVAGKFREMKCLHCSKEECADA